MLVVLYVLCLLVRMACVSCFKCCVSSGVRISICFESSGDNSMLVFVSSGEDSMC